MNLKTEGLTSWIFLFFPVWADGFSFYKLPGLASYSNCHLIRTYYVLGSEPSTQSSMFLVFFLLVRHFHLNLCIKMKKKVISSVVKESDSEICLYFAIYSKYYWNSCRCPDESSSVEWEMWEHSFVRTLHFSSFMANRKGDCCAFY